MVEFSKYGRFLLMKNFQNMVDFAHEDNSQWYSQWKGIPCQAKKKKSN